MDYYHDKAKYRTTAKPHPGPKDLVAAVDLLKQAQRPIIVSSNDFRAALERCYQLAVKESRPSLINCQGKKEFWVRQQYEPGFLGTVRNSRFGNYSS